jgi:transcriptional regulator of nitric oxide reductase
MHDNRIHAQMRIVVTVMALILGAITIGRTQLAVDPKLQGQLKLLFPAVVGLAFWTTEVEPLERGYDGPIKILIGMDTKGILTGIIVAQHHEPYGDFSIEPPQFAAQFKGKNIRDPFKVGVDIDAVSRATITINSAVRAIRTSARRIATRLLVPPTSTK